MADVLTPQQRSYNMSRIKSRETGPEIRLRKLLFAKGIRGYRTNYGIPGRPDIVFTRLKIAVFIDGCFWHKCPKCFKKPATRSKFWMDKINSNVKRDREVNEILKKAGWKVIRLWEHEINETPAKAVDKIAKILLKYS